MKSRPHQIQAVSDDDHTLLLIKLEQLEAESRVLGQNAQPGRLKLAVDKSEVLRAIAYHFAGNYAAGR